MQQHRWFDQLLVLDREKIEAELGQTGRVAAPNGLIALRLREEEGGTAPLNGDYVMYLRVERR